MQSRRLRLGDVVDDYCPRERRLSNHVIVAMVDDTIKQTRCSTCDFEHPYKDGKLPTRRARKDSPPSLYQQVLDNVTEGSGAAPVVPDVVAAPGVGTRAARGVLRANGSAGPDGHDGDGADADEARAASPAGPAPAADDEREPGDEGPVHRTLIRATLPRQEGDVPVWPIATFTIREAAAAPKFRRFRPKRGGRPFGEGFGNQGGGGGFKNPQFGAQPGRGPGPGGQKPGGGPNRGNQPPRVAGNPGGRRNNQPRRGNNKGPR